MSLRPLGLLGILAILCPGTSRAQEEAAGEELRAPMEIRDEHVLAQGRLTLPAVAAPPVPKGKTRLRLAFLWGNSFAWTQDVPGENPLDRRFLIDGETRTADLTAARGLAEGLDVGLRLPLRWRGGGSLDGFIDAWHRTFAFAGIPDGDRPDFRRDAFRVEGVTTAGDPFAWEDATGTGLGNLEVSSRWRLHDGRAQVALVPRLSIPTATRPYERTWGAGLQLVMQRPLARLFDLHLGAGGTVESGSSVRGITYEPARFFAHLAFVYRPWTRLALSVETDVASRLVEDIDHYPGVHWLINGGLKLRAAPALVLELGLTENLKDQLSTTDFALYFAVSVTP